MAKKKKISKVHYEKKKMVDEQDKNDIISEFKVEPIRGRTYLVLVVVDTQNEKNKQQSIRCYHGHAFAEGYPYDQAQDCYLVSCVENHALGSVNVAYEISMPVCGIWKVQIPLPPSVIEHYLDAHQKSALSSIQEKYKSERYAIHVMQMAGCEA